uniref:Uncharacterized protein n=1 Tax=Callorhinchus milii TaxID=7868 RepID=A0A4W3GE91_CALMI
MLPLKEKDRAVVRMLLSAGCCPRCVLRFCFVGTQTLYRLSCKVSGSFVYLRVNTNPYIRQAQAL